MSEKEKIRVVELWNKVGDNRKPQKSVSFYSTHVYTTQHDEELPDGMIEGLEKLETLQEALQFISENYR